MEHYVRPDGMPPVNGYSHAVSFEGQLVVVSGQVPVDADGRLVEQGDPEAQVRQVFRNLDKALAAAGATMDHIVKLTVFLADMADLDVLRKVREEYIRADKPPASSLVRVAGLVNPEWRIEVEALAAI
jgi:reactive intermediate/imine deaminase